MRFILLVVVAILMVLGTGHLGSVALSLMNAPSDGSVGFGVALLGVLFAAWVTLFVKFQKHMLTPGSLQFNEAGRRWWKKLFLVTMIVTCPSLSGCICTRVDSGHVGIVINLAGSNRGVEDIPQQTGWVFYNPLTEQVFQFPTFVQTAVWSSSPHEGSPNNEEVIFNSKKGMIITGDISLSYRLEPTKVPAFYVKFRTDDLNTFTHSFLRNVARDAFGETACKYETEDIYGAGKDQLLKEVTKKVNDKVNPYGIIIEQFGFIGSPRLPENVVKSLNESQAAVQKAIQTENEIRQVQAEAKKNIAESQGRASAAMQQARATADARVMQAKAEAEANLVLSKSITPELIRWKTIQVLEKWDGRRPMVEGSGSSGFLFQLPAPDKETSTISK